MVRHVAASSSSPCPTCRQICLRMSYGGSSWCPQPRRPPMTAVVDETEPATIETIAMSASRVDQCLRSTASLKAQRPHSRYRDVQSSRRRVLDDREWAAVHLLVARSCLKCCRCDSSLRAVVDALRWDLHRGS